MDDKVKRIPESRFYNQNIGFLLIIITFCILIFFTADKSIGAVGLRTLYGQSGIITAITLLVILLFLQGFWGNISFRKSAIAIFVVIITTIIVWNTRISNVAELEFSSWIFLTSVSCITYVFSLYFLHKIYYVFPIAFLIFIGFWLKIRYMNYRVGRLDMVRLVNVVTVYAISFLFTSSYLIIVNQSQIWGEAHIANNHYYLYVELGNWDESDTVILYECNEIGLFCKNVFQDYPYGLRWDKPILEETDNSIQVRFEPNNTVYIHEPDN